MSFSLIESIILDLILILFPLLLYLVLVCHQEDSSKSRNSIILTVCLFTSLYLCLRFGYINQNSKIMLFCNIPIVIAYLKKDSALAIILSLINIIYCYFIFDTLYIIAIIKYASYFILYSCAGRKKLSIDGFILCIAVLQGFFLSFEYCFQIANISINNFILMIALSFAYYFATFFSLYIFKIIERVESLNKSIKILEKDKMVKEALFKLTHEIKNPLAVCQGYLDMIDLDNRTKSEKYLSIMRQEISRSLNIISDFVEFNKIKLSKEQIDLSYFLEDIYDSFKIIINSKNIKFSYRDNLEEDIYFLGDYERLKQVIVNLLKNSLEAIKDKGKIDIYPIIHKKYLEIVIEDNGIGMNKEDLSKLKEMFYTTKKNGTGLGVSLSNEIVEAHHGELIYTSELNKGTKATIKLPYA